MMLALTHSRPAVSWAALLKGHFLLRNTFSGPDFARSNSMVYIMNYDFHKKAAPITKIC
jgi:hypothetical protein